MAVPIHLVANNILQKSFDEDNRITLMKLQKMLYLIESEYVKETKESLFGVEFQAWQYGPVNTQLYDILGCFGKENINIYIKNAQGKGETLRITPGSVLETILNRIWVRTRKLDAATLARLTTEPGSAWHKAWVSKERNIKVSDILEDYTYRQKRRFK